MNIFGSATGGSGGDANGSGNGGNGGNAILNPVYGKSTSGGILSWARPPGAVAARAWEPASPAVVLEQPMPVLPVAPPALCLCLRTQIGGIGGSGLSGARAANGADSVMLDQVSGSAGSLTLGQSAAGGGGRRQRLCSRQGRLCQLNPDRGESGHLFHFLLVSADGGQGGNGESAANGGLGEMPWQASSSRVRVIFPAMPTPLGAMAAVPTAAATAARAATPH